MIKSNLDPVLTIIKRRDHVEVHFDKRVEFWDYNNVKLGESKVESVYFCSQCNKAVTDEILCPQCGNILKAER